MGWLSSLFASSSQNLRKGQAMSSTHDAFSLPTSSPTFAHPDAFNPDTLNTPDPSTAASPSYTYPPRDSYGYVPSDSRPGPLLPLHRDSMLSQTTPYPPLAKTWARIRAWLEREYPELGDTLNYGILPQDLAQIEMQFGFALPAVVRESYLAVDGQEAESAAGCAEGLFFGLTLLPLDDVLEEWRFWREVDDDPATGANSRLRDVMQSIPPGWIRHEYSQRGWIPLIADKAGNYIGVDMNPAERGDVGQVIVFGRDFDTKVVLWRGDGPAGWAKWLAGFVEDLESGEGYEIGANDQSEGSEDDVGYESYYHDGSGRGQGDGGGDSGPGGGLRLTGEYRGWSVLDAWADRSVRRWYDAGVLTDPLEKGKAPENVGLGVLDIADLTQSTSAEVPIPVLADVEPVYGNTAPRPPVVLPTISVTKPPAPLPVELPTPRDIAPSPSPPDSVNSFDHDLETGRGTGMREVPQPVRKSPVPVRRENADASGSSSVPALPPPASAVPLPASPSANIPDLLADSAPEMATTPIEPSTPARAEPLALASEPAGSGAEAASPSNPEEPNPAPDVTVRLVGGASIAASVPLPPEEETAESDFEDIGDAESIKSATSVSSSKDAGAKKHKSKGSLASLKKFGQLGLRKKDSSSVKDAN